MDKEFTQYNIDIINSDIDPKFMINLNENIIFVDESYNVFGFLI